MKLILTDYIASLKEDQQLDALVQEILRSSEIEIVFGPQRGRQHGVDVYAMGVDPKDGIAKVILVTVKQGNLDRKNWQGSVNALRPSLEEIISVFVRNNLLPQHVGLPIKIVVAHNGAIDAAIQQDWKGFAELHPKYDFEIWPLETLVTLVHEKLLNENVFSDNAKHLLRRIIIYCYNPDYDLKEYKDLLEDIISAIDLASPTLKKNIRQLRKINLVMGIVTTYCEQENDLRLAVRVTEITTLRLWKFFHENNAFFDRQCFIEFLNNTFHRQRILGKYLEKMIPVCAVKDGFSKYSIDPVTYSMTAYEHMGMLALVGLEFLQLAQLVAEDEEVVKPLLEEVGRSCDAVIALFNNNRIVDNPRADNQMIEWSLVFLLLFKVGRTEDIKKIVISIHNQMVDAKQYFNLAPVYSNSMDEIFQLDVDNEKRKTFEYGSSSLLTMLFEWAAILGDEKIFEMLKTFKGSLFKDISLVQWFPDETTEQHLYTSSAIPETGHCLMLPDFPSSLSAYDEWLLKDFIFNCHEVGYKFFEYNQWTIGLTASRHYRTPVFPAYWRSCLVNSCPLKSDEPKSEIPG